MIGLEAERSATSSTACCGGSAEPEHGTVVHGDRAQCLRRGRRGAPARRAAVTELCVAVGLLGQPAAGRRHRGRLPRRDPGRARPEGQAAGDRGTAQCAALALPQRRALLSRRSSNRDARDRCCATSPRWRSRCARRERPRPSPSAPEAAPCGRSSSPRVKRSARGSRCWRWTQPEPRSATAPVDLVDLPVQRPVIVQVAQPD